MMPLPAVIHCTSPAAIKPRLPRLSPCSTSPARTYVMVSMPRCGCQGKPALYSSGLSLRKSSSSRNGSNSLVSPKPKARRRCTPAPSMVGLDSMIFFTGRMDMTLSPFVRTECWFKLRRRSHRSGEPRHQRGELIEEALQKPPRALVGDGAVVGDQALLKSYIGLAAHQQ